MSGIFKKQEIEFAKESKDDPILKIGGVTITGGYSIDFSRKNSITESSNINEEQIIENYGVANFRFRINIFLSANFGEFIPYEQMSSIVGLQEKKEPLKIENIQANKLNVYQFLITDINVGSLQGQTISMSLECIAIKEKNLELSV